MNLKMIMSIKSVICWIFGLAFLILPVQAMAIFGITVTEGGSLITRVLGATFIILALYLGLARDTEEILTKRATAISFAIGDAIGCALMVYALIVGISNPYGWIVAAIYLLLAIGFGYSLFAEPELRLAM